MQFIKSFENIQRPFTHTTKLLIKYYGFSADKESDCAEDCLPYHGSSPDDESDCAEHCLPECPQVNADPNEYQTLNEMCQDKCSGYNKYSFHDFLVQAVSHVEAQPSNKEYFEPKGSLIKQIKMENKTK